MNSKLSKKNILFLILIAAAIFRLYGLSRGDTVSDEVFMAFRGLGMIDFDAASAQTTPWEWWDSERPQWTSFSMHDHPWGVPLVQNLSMKIFGESNFGFRLPSALLGIASVYALYLIGALLYAEEVGLIAAALLAVTVNNIYVSRLGLQESYVILAILLSSYFFLKSLHEPKYLLWTGVLIGIGAEMKYTALILIPMLVTYLILFRREYFRNRYFWQGIAAFLLIFSPTIIYNIGLYSATGHLDFQFSHILGNYPPEWKTAPGKEIGDMAYRIGEFAPRLIRSNSWLFLSAYAAALLAFGLSLIRRTKEAVKIHKFIILTTGFLVLLVLLVGPSYRFLTLLAPFMALAVAVFFSRVRNRFQERNNFTLILLAAFLFFEMFYSANNQIAYYPSGPAPWLASDIRYENYNWGYNELGEYLKREFSGRMPAVAFDMKYQFLEKLQDNALADGKAAGADLYPALIVYAGNFDGGTKLWILDRFSIYHAWPILDLQTYFDYLNVQGFDYVERSGFKVVYFIQSSNWVPPGDLGILTSGAYQGIRNQRGDEVFKIYKTIIYE